MKLTLIILFLLSCLFCYSQNGQITGVIIDTTELLGYRPVTIRLIKDSVEVAATIAMNDGRFYFQNIAPGTYQINDGRFYFQNIAPGTYQLVLSSIGERKETRDSITIKNGQALQLSIRYPGPCLYNYPKHYKPHCPENHTDNIVRIVYGLPTEKTMQKAKKGKVHLGGCNLTGCDPNYYCITHKRDF